MTAEDLAKEIINDNGGSIVPTFNRELGTAFYQTTGVNLNKTLFSLADKKEVTKDFVRWAPERFTDNGDGTISLELGGVKVNRRVGKDGRISEAIFYVPCEIPEWVNRNTSKDHTVEDLVTKLKAKINDRLGDDVKIQEAIKE